MASPVAMFVGVLPLLVWLISAPLIIAGSTRSTASGNAVLLRKVLPTTAIASLKARDLRQTAVKLGPSGGSYSPTSSFEASCPGTAFITSFTGRSGSLIDALGATCKDGTKLGPWGGAGGNAFASPVYSTGFVEVNGRAGSLLDQISVLPMVAGATRSTFGGGGGNPFAAPLRCSAGYVIAGIFGTSAGYLVKVGIICKPVVTCAWAGHCLGDPCTTYNDCDGTMICVNNKCATSSVSGVTPNPAPPPPPIGVQKTTITSYNVMTGDNTAVGELVDYTVSQNFVNHINIVSVHEQDWEKYKYKKVSINYKNKAVIFEVWDLCADKDCSPIGCCTENKAYQGNGFLLDMDSAAVLRNWNIADAENALKDSATFTVVGTVNDPASVVALWP